MKNNLQKIFAAVAIAGTTFLAGCHFQSPDFPSPVSSDSSPTPTPEASPKPSPASPSLPQATPTPTPPPQQQIAVTIYQMDSQCRNLVPKTIQVPKKQPLEATLRKLLQPWNDGDFSLVGYRLQVNEESQQATVDLRLAPNARRQFVSLSSCEQRALFGSLRQTMTQSSQWQIQKVEFTSGGEPIHM